MIIMIIQYLSLSARFFYIMVFSTYIFNYFYNSKGDKTSFLGSIFYTFLYFMSMMVNKILYIPLTCLALSFFQCDNLNYTVYPSTFCVQSGFSSKNSNIAISIILLIMMNIFSILTNIFFNDMKFNTEMSWSRIPCFSYYILMILKFFLSFAFMIKFDDNSAFKSIKIFVNVFLTVVIICLRFRHLLMSSQIVFLVSIIFEGSFVFNSFVAIVNEYAKIKLFEETIIVQIVTSLFFGLLIYNIIDNIQESCQNKDLFSISDVKEAHIHIYRISRLSILCKESMYYKSLYLSIFQNIDLNVINQTVNVSNILVLLIQKYGREI